MSCFNLFNSGRAKLTPKQQNYEYSLTRGFATEGSSALFDGNLYSNMFKVNESILLTGVSFFGPSEVEKTMYLVYIEIREMKKDEMKKFVLTDFWDIVEVEKRQMFRVTFDTPLLLTKKVVYDIRFEIKGPETEYCADLTKYTVVGTYRDLVTFDFLARSKQMPEIYFKLA